MSRRARFWMVVAVVFTLVNLGGAVFAALTGEVTHSLTHVGMLVATAVLLHRFMPRAAANY